MTTMRVLWIIALICLIAISIASPVLRVTRAVDDDPYRLSENVVPSHYTIHLTLGNDLFETNQFSGVSDVVFSVTNNTSAIKIHAPLLIDELVLTSAEDPTLQNEFSTQFDNVTEILLITTEVELQAGVNYSLRFVYTAQLRGQGGSNLNGLYRSYYVDDNGNVRNLATTQLQPTHARKVFPSFDEPNYKARFDIAITHPFQLNAVGNTRGFRIDTIEWTTTIFETTPIMPTYLIAFVISDFTCTEGPPVEDVDIDDNGVRIPHRICSRPNSEGTPRNFSVENGPKIMNALEEITGIKYSESGIGKVDQFAIPDFAAGAMENWGLVTYREYYLLWDPVESTNRYQQFVATIVSHELGHMWFGDLITTHWWSDTFLNEGFATYCEYFGAHAVFPNWQLDKQFVISEFQPVLQLDSQASANPLSHPASSPSDISERFGTISYSKGGSVFRMVEGFLGQKKFRQGIYLYLDNHKFRNTVPKDLWDAFGQVQGIGDSLPIGVTINEVMENWIVKPGFPVLTVSLNGRNITISQKRFLLSEEPEADEKWYVPISYTTRSEPNFEDTLPKDWLTPDKDLTISNALNNPNDWIILNVQQTGYFRVNYDEQLWERISVALLNQVNLADELTRAQIVDDLFNFAKVDLLTYSRILNIINFLEYDDSYYPWYSALTAINTLLVRLGDDVVRHVLNQHILKLLTTFYASIAPVAEENDDNMIYTHKKVLALTWACRLGLEDCVSGSKQLYQRFVENGEKPNKNYRPIIYCTALRNSTNALDDWQALFEEFTRTTDTIQRPTLLTALGCTTDDDVRTEFLNRALDQNSGLRQSEVASAFSAIYTGNPSGIDFALDYLIQNYLEIVAYYSNVGPIFTGLATRLSRRQQIDKLQEFLVVNRNSLTPNVVNTISSGLTTAEANLRWTLQFEAQLKEHFDTTSSETEPSSTPTTTERNSGSKTFISWTAIVLFALITFSS